MEILETILSFSLVMVVMTTIATLFMEFAVRLMKLRQKGLEQMLMAMFDDLLWPRFQYSAQKIAKTAGLKTSQESMRDAFVTKLMARPAGKKIFEKINTGDTTRTELSPIEFIEELADTPVGQAIRAEADALDSSFERTMQTLLLKYDQVADAASRSFQAKSRQWTFFFGIITAITFAFNPVYVFDQIATEKGTRAKLIAQKDAILQASTDAQNRLAELLKDNPEDRCAEAENDTATGSASESKADDACSLRNHVTKLKKESADAIGNLQSIGLPIGRNFTPGNLGKTCTRPADLKLLPMDMSNGPFKTIDIPICKKLVTAADYGIEPAVALLSFSVGMDQTAKNSKTSNQPVATVVPVLSQSGTTTTDIPDGHAIKLPGKQSYALKSGVPVFILSGKVNITVGKKHHRGSVSSGDILAGTAVSVVFDQDTVSKLDKVPALWASRDTILILKKDQSTGPHARAEIAKFQFAGTTGDSVIWWVQVLVGGILIGLGGPFWFDTVRKISMVSSVTKTVRQSLLRSTPDPQAQPSQPAPEADLATQAKSAANRFKEVTDGISPPEEVQSRMDDAKKLIADIIQLNPEARDQIDSDFENLQDAANTLDYATMDKIIAHLRDRAGELKANSI